MTNETKPPLMSGDQFRYAIDVLGLTQVGAAKFLGVEGSTARRWIAGRRPIPDATAMLLTLMIERRETPDQVAALCANAKLVATRAAR